MSDLSCVQSLLHSKDPFERSSRAKKVKKIEPEYHLELALRVCQLEDDFEVLFKQVLILVLDAMSQ